MKDSDIGDGQPFDATDVSAAEKLAGLSLDNSERWLLLARARRQLDGYSSARQAELPNSLEPALHFRPLPPVAARAPRPPAVGPFLAPPAIAPVPPEELAFLPVTRLAALLRAGHTSSLDLTRLALQRLSRFGPKLRCLVTLTEELALEQAERADKELAEGVDRGALHGIPYGAKDLLAVPGYPTTWGAEPYRRQRFDEAATVVERLEQAGAVLVAKLSLGELAMGDVWFGGMTLSPWDPGKGSSGSSAGSASAVAAGLVPFAIGSETMGSIVSPATRCGVAGLRPSANLVSRHGAMALAWSLDKLGPLARSVEDCALVLQAIAGPDGKDASLAARGFEWDGRREVEALRIGYLAEAFEAEGPARERNMRILDRLRSRGLEPTPVTLPDFAPEPITTVLMVEAAAAFNELTRSGRDDELAQQGQDAWPNLFRAARLVPAVEYVQANRLRTLAVRQMAALFEDVDAYLCPSSHHANLYLTNATGNPAVAVPVGFEASGAPIQSTMTVTAGLFRDQEALLVARAVEQAVEEIAGARPRPDLGRLF
jgi:Asp-tRNA(Asn)/Glu-tRNA(Gln) amidotransferase A subunit family amidase